MDAAAVGKENEKEAPEWEEVGLIWIRMLKEGGVDDCPGSLGFSDTFPFFSVPRNGGCHRDFIIK